MPSNSIPCKILRHGQKSVEHNRKAHRRTVERPFEAAKRLGETAKRPKKIGKSRQKDPEIWQRDGKKTRNDIKMMAKIPGQIAKRRQKDSGRWQRDGKKTHIERYESSNLVILPSGT